MLFFKINQNVECSNDILTLNLHFSELEICSVIRLIKCFVFAVVTDVREFSQQVCHLFCQ